MFERFTDRARAAVVLGQEEARRLDSDHISPAHLLLGILGEEANVGCRALQHVGIDVPAFRAHVRSVAEAGGGAPSTGHLTFAGATKKALELSLREALQLGHDWIDTGHVLLGVIRVDDQTLAPLLPSTGGLRTMRAAVDQVIAADRPSRRGRSKRPPREPGPRREPTALPPPPSPPPAAPGAEPITVVVERNPAPSSDDLQRLSASCERLLGLASYSLQQGEWADASPGTESDVENTIRNLADELHPLVERPVNPVLIEGFALRLSGHLVTAQQRRADDAEALRTALLEIDVGLLDPATRAHLSAQPSAPAAEAANWIAEHTDWQAVQAPEWLPEQERFDDFAAAAGEDPYSATAALLGWRSAVGPLADKLEGVMGTAESHSVVFGVLGVGGGALTGTSTGAVAGGIVGIVVGVIVAILAANYRGRSEDSPSDGP
jgi:hypothetical protein